jgi:hypothetical protein
MTQIPTAEELATQMQESLGYDDLINPIKFASLVAIELTKLHIEAALKVASELSNLDLANDNAPDKLISLPDDILNSYPLTNIK